MFNKQVDAFASRLQENKVYTFSGGQIKMANKRFTSIPNDYCITFDNHTDIQECSDDTMIKQEGFQFTQINRIKDLGPGSTVDIIGAIMEVGQLGSILTKSGDSRQKRELKIADESNAQISITLWGSVCEA
jgi:replication factor A1